MICGVRYRSGSVRSAMISSGKGSTSAPRKSLPASWSAGRRCSFAEEVGALSREEAIALLERARSAIFWFGRYSGRTSSERGAGRPFPRPARRCDQQRSCSCHERRRQWPAGQCRSLGLASGDCRRRQPGTPGLAAQGRADRLADADDLFLDPESAFAAVQKLARDQGTSVPLKQRTLWKRLAEQGHLVSRDWGRGTNTVRRTIGGRRLEVIHLQASTFAVETDQPSAATAQTDQQSAEKTQQIQCRGQFGQFGQKMKQGGPAERGLRDAVGWELDI